MKDKNMTTFGKNPFSEVRKKVKSKIFKIGLERTLKKKFKHKQFSERFRMANLSFLAMGFIAQFASLITAFTMLSYLFAGTNIVVRVLCSAVLVLILEAIKRESTNDVMQGGFQAEEVELFPTLLAVITVSASIYISVQGAKILPSILVAAAEKETPMLQSPNTINEDFNARISDKENERNEYRKKRTWKGRLASKDAKIIKQYNEDIKVLQSQKDAALNSLNNYNQDLIVKANERFQGANIQVSNERDNLSKQLVVAAVTFEVLFLLSLCFSWWYYAECLKENETTEVTTQDTVNQNKGTTEVHSDTLGVQPVTLEVAGGSAGQRRKVGYKDYEDVNETVEVPLKTTEVEKVKKEFTRICPVCETGFVHRSANHTCCSRSCTIKRIKERNKKTK